MPPFTLYPYFHNCGREAAIRATSRIEAHREVGVCPENCGWRGMKQRSFGLRREAMGPV